VTRLNIYWAGLLLLVLLVFWPGCDGGGSKREAQYKRLVGTWEVQVLRQGRITLSRDASVKLTFRGGERRSYRLRYEPARGDTNTVSGNAELLGENTLRFSQGFSRPLVWTFSFAEPDELNDSVQFRLASRWDGSAQEFLASIGRSGTNQPVEMDLELRE